MRMVASGAQGIMPEGARGGTRNGSRTSAPLFVPLIRVPSPKSEAMHASPASVLQRDALCIPRRNGPVGERTCMLSRPSVCDAGPVMLAFFFGCTDIDIEALTMRALQCSNVKWETRISSVLI